jgi:hypothetical protein
MRVPFDYMCMEEYKIAGAVKIYMIEAGANLKQKKISSLKSKKSLCLTKYHTMKIHLLSN